VTRVLVVGAGPALGATVAGLLDKGLDVESVPDGATLDEQRTLQADLVVSLLPADQATGLLQRCVVAGRSLVSLSPLAPDGAEQLGSAPEARATVLSGVGLVSGLATLSLAETVEGIRGRGGRIRAVRTYVGHLPAPEALDNPLGHKLASDARDELLLLREGASYREAGRPVEVPSSRLLRHVHVVEIDGHGEFEAYPLGDSSRTLEPAGVAEAATLFYGTFRGLGWCDTLQQFGRLGLLSLEPVETRAGTCAELLRYLVGCTTAEDLASAAARRLGVSRDSGPVWNLQWLGLLSQRPLPTTRIAPLDALAKMMNERLRLRPGERDRVILRHDVVAGWADGRGERHVADLVEYGAKDGQSARDLMLALPAVVASTLLLDGTIGRSGWLRATDACVRRPLLESLARHGVAFRETVAEFRDPRAETGGSTDEAC
jgi:saccharopine dehydrogenase-like NADP-dependent oxidoreductase